MVKYIRKQSLLFACTRTQVCLKRTLKASGERASPEMDHSESILNLILFYLQMFNFFLKKIQTKNVFYDILSNLGLPPPPPVHWQILLDSDSTHHGHHKVIRNSWSKPSPSTPKWPPNLPMFPGVLFVTEKDVLRNTLEN